MATEVTEEKITATFVLEKETKNTIRFIEEDDVPAMGTLAGRQERYKENLCNSGGRIMKRRFVIQIGVEVESSPFDGELLSRQLQGYLEVEPKIGGEYADIMWTDMAETTTPGAIACAVADEVAEVVGRSVAVERIGDNGSDDAGCELTDSIGRSYAIGITKVGDVWYVSLEIDRKDYPVDGVDDLESLLQ